MKKSAYGKPLLIHLSGNEHLQKVEFQDELEIQSLVYNNPALLPVSDIDESYNPLIPVCMELRTNAGFLDILMVTPNGDLSIIEAKLWRNPEARRKVIGQILDYANELSKWTYEDLQREVNRNLNRKGNSLYEIAKTQYSSDILRESDFVDAVSRNLRRGKFLLLILGDGIREGASGIADFLTNSAHLNFTFGMVELGIFNLPDGERIVIPRTIAKTVEIQKITFDYPANVSPIPSAVSSQIEEAKDSKVAVEQEQLRVFFRDFWSEFVQELDFDDPGQPLPKPSQTQNIYLYMGASKYAWISCYFAQSQKRVGVYFRCADNQNGQQFNGWLHERKLEIIGELGNDVMTRLNERDPSDGFTVRLTVNDVYSQENRQEIKEFFKLYLNQFVNIIRPRVKEFEERGS